MSLLGPRGYRKKTSFGPDCETLGVPALAARSASRPERRVWDYPANSDLVHDTTLKQAGGHRWQLRGRAPERMALLTVNVNGRSLRRTAFLWDPTFLTL